MNADVTLDGRPIQHYMEVQRVEAFTSTDQMCVFVKNKGYVQPKGSEITLTLPIRHKAKGPVPKEQTESED